MDRHRGQVEAEVVVVAIAVGDAKTHVKRVVEVLVLVVVKAHVKMGVEAPVWEVVSEVANRHVQEIV